MAAVNAARSTETGLAVSKSITVEALLYASAQDQITKALARMGVNAKARRRLPSWSSPTAKTEAEEAYVRPRSSSERRMTASLRLTPRRRRSLRKHMASVTRRSRPLAARVL